MKISLVTISALFLVGCESPQRNVLLTTKQDTGAATQFAVADWDMSAGEMADNMPRGDQLIALQRQNTNATDQPELDVSLGLLYSQCTGFVNPSNAVVYFTKALGYDLPERAYIEVVMWRGNCEEELHKYNEALTDYLRGLLACSYYDLSGGWPEIGMSTVSISINSSDPENEQRQREYILFRRHLDFQQFLLMQRYYLIDAVKRVRGEKSDNQIPQILQELAPESSKCETIMGWLKSENKRPWP